MSLSPQAAYFLLVAVAATALVWAASPRFRVLARRAVAALAIGAVVIVLVAGHTVLADLTSQ